MVGHSVAVAVPSAMAAKQATKAALPRGAARDLYRMICALSGACERDSGVLRDGALVDTLELKAKQILRARRALSSSSSSVASSVRSHHRLSTSPVLAPQPPMKVSKRRKLPAQDYNKMDHTYGYDTSPRLSSSPTLIEPQDYDVDKASLYMARGDGSSSLIPSVKIGKIEPSKTHKLSPYQTAMAGDVVVNSVALSNGRSPSSSPIHMEHFSLVKPAPRPSRQSLDLGASMASTVSSMSMQHYDLSDAEDGAPSSYTPRSRYASAHTSYDYDSFTPIRHHDSYGEDRAISPITDLDDSYLSELGAARPRRKDSCYSETSTSSLSGRATPKKLRFEMDALSLYEKESSFKEVESGLVETLQSQVDLLLTENVTAVSENVRLTELSQMSACEAEAQSVEKLHAVEHVKQQAQQIAELEEKYLDTKQRADAQEGFRREAEVAFQSELDAKAELVSALQKQVTAKDEEIGRLTKRVEDISGLFASKMRGQEGQRVSLTRSSSAGQSAGSPTKPVTTSADEPEMVTSLRESNMFMDMELERMRESLLEKDREICNLYMHLSTKKKLIDEITKKFVQHMEEAAAATKATGAGVEVGAIGLSPESVRFDLDMFLFKNVVDKQRRMEELTAALGVMDREVESLEARVADKERENKQLRENQEFLTRSLQTVNTQMGRIQSENETLGASVQENQARISSLVSSLEEKDHKIKHLDEQVDLRQMQIDHLMSEDKSSGRRLLKNSLMKARASFSSSTVKGSSRLSFTSGRGEDEETSQRGSIASAASARRSGSMSTPRKSLSSDTVMTTRSSLEWTDAHRPSVVMAQRTSQPAIDFANTKRSSVFSDVFKDISSPISDDEGSLFGASASDVRSTRASYCASEINDDEELYNELFAKA